MWVIIIMLCPQISIFSQMPNIKVLTLSVNRISSLAPLAGCLSLCELYLRRNLIPSLSELSHLRSLTNLKVLWLAENPCCETESTVTEDELSLAIMEGEVVTTPPASVQNQLSSNGLPETETENDPLNYNMEETNKIREELGMKPLSRDKFPSLSPPSTRENTSPMKR
ncbi:hypothetical protein INR49_000355 [Caranx melampygus]|nr:hypothetical protein INR49_000355 [Caranx melampygus]